MAKQKKKSVPVRRKRQGHAAPPASKPATRPLAVAAGQAIPVRVVIDGITESGRHLLRGVMQYARSNTKWSLRVEMDPLYPKGSEWQDDGATIYASHVSALLMTIVQRGRPIVNCMAHHEALKLPTVRSNDYAIGVTAAKYLIEKGFERFAFYAAKDRSLAAELRYSGLARTVLEAGLTLIGEGWETNPGGSLAADAPRLVAALETLPKPLAVFASHDVVARDLAEQVTGAGMQVPEHIAILGVDNDELQSEISRPALSSIQVPHGEIGFRAAQLLDQLLQGKPAPEASMLIDPRGVVTRQSTALFVHDEPHLVEALRYIREHACDPCGVDDVLRNTDVSRRWLEGQFKRRFGRTPHEAITLTRMERAKQLLREPDQTLKSIAVKSGYFHVQNFVGAFRKTVGETPAAYRRRLGLVAIAAGRASDDGAGSL